MTANQSDSIRTLTTNPFDPDDKMWVSKGQIVNWEKRAKKLANKQSYD